MFRKLFFLSLLTVISSAGVLAQTRTRPAAPKPAAPAATNLKITYKVTAAGGQTMESTTMLKGKRERSETRSAYMDSVSITQCDLKRNIQINNKSQKYFVTPMETVTASQTTTAPVGGTSSSPVTRGGVVTYTTNTVDTGERKEMFGFTARHIKTTLKIESSPDACNPTQYRMETDGWYIDLTYGLECDFTATQTTNPYGAQGGCRDRTVFKRTGAGRTGYALSETTTMYGSDGNATFTSTREVVDLSREPLDAALFEVPAGYTEVKDSAELYATPTTTAATSSQSNVDSSYSNQTSNNNAGETKAPGTVRIGVVTINNKTGKPLSIDSLRDRLIGNISTSGVEAIPLNAISQTEAEVEAKTKQCDFILYTDLSGLKTSAAKKIGGMFGQAIGASGPAKTEAKVEFKLFKAGESSPRLQSSATAKEEGEEASAGVAIDSEAKQVGAAVRK
jgi:hypothetical protein